MKMHIIAFPNQTNSTVFTTLSGAKKYRIEDSTMKNLTKGLIAFEDKWKIKLTIEYNISKKLRSAFVYFSCIFIKRRIKERQIMELRN